MTRLFVPLVLLGACGGEDYVEPTPPEVGNPCDDDAACEDIFTCQEVDAETKLCSAHCSEDADCGDAGRCVDVGSEGDPQRLCLRDCTDPEYECEEPTVCTVYPPEAASACR